MSMDIFVQRKNGRVMSWDENKVKNAVLLSALTINKEVKEDFLSELSSTVYNKLVSFYECLDDDCIVAPVSKIHDIVIDVLETMDKDIHRQYKDYRNYKERYSKSFENIKDDTLRIVYSGDKENANKDSSIISTQKELVAGTVSQEMMLEWELPADAKEKHKGGLIYIHDLRDHMYDSINCCLYDLGRTIENGFEVNGIHIEEPDSFETFMDLANDIMMVASSQQFGGFTFPEIDKVGAKYLRNTYNRIYNELMGYGLPSIVAIDKAHKKTWEICLKKCRMYEYKVNCVNNSTGQTPFHSISIGLDTDEFARMIARAILTVRLEGMGKNKTTAIFPKIMFLHRQDINGIPGSPNYDIKQLAILCSSENQYPDWISLDSGLLGEIYDRCGEAVTMMGCRAALSPWCDEEGKETYVGRFNIGAVTMQLVRIALESNGNEDEFFKLLDKCIDSGINFHLYKYAKMSKQKSSSNPLFFTQGGCAVQCDPNGTIEKALECATASIGYIGLNEACVVLSGKELHENLELAEKIMKRLKDRVDEASKKHNRLFALYGTPSEGLCDKALKKDREDFGVIDGVTDKDWYSNSHHVSVTAEISAIEKAKIESKLYKYPTGGRIFYTEWPHTDNMEALEQYINFCMSLGLYIGINFDNGKCNDCGHKGKFKDDTCPKCGSTNVLIITRVCGYLGVYKANGETRYNQGKEAEVKNRFKHYNYIADSCL